MRRFVREQRRLDQSSVSLSHEGPRRSSELGERPRAHCERIQRELGGASLGGAIGGTCAILDEARRRRAMRSLGFVGSENVPRMLGAGFERAIAGTSRRQSPTQKAAEL